MSLERALDNSVTIFLKHFECSVWLTVIRHTCLRNDEKENQMFFHPSVNCQHNHLKKKGLVVISGDNRIQLAVWCCRTEYEPFRERLVF